jgi:hypothetical protein
VIQVVSAMKAIAAAIAAFLSTYLDALPKPRRLLVLVLALGLLSGCSLPQVKAEDRVFLHLSLDFLGEYRLPKQTVAETPVGGLSGLVYDRQRDRFYAVSDDRSNLAPARFYTLKLAIGTADSADANSSAITLQSVEVESVTPLLAADGQPYPANTIDLEGIALSPQRSLFMASEGDRPQNVAPFIAEFSLDGQWQRQLPIPARFLPAEVEGQPIGVQNNLSFESLTLNADGSTGNRLEPFRVFAATESALHQDLLPLGQPSEEDSDVDPLTQAVPIRFLHYLLEDDRATLLSEHLYLTEPAPEGADRSGLTEILTLDQGGHFLSLERTFGLTTGFNAQIFQLATGGATDVSGIPAFAGEWSGITSIYKRPLLDLSSLDIPLDNLEGMTLGPRLPDGTDSLLLVSDDNFNDFQTTQFLLFRLRKS